MSKDEDSRARWEALCAAYGRMRDRDRDTSFRLGRLSIHLAEALAEACGCDKTHIGHYSYDAGPDPSFDSFEQVKNGWHSVDIGQNRGHFGLGVLLEIASNVVPKTNVVFPVEVEVEPDRFIVTTPLINSPFSFTTDAPGYGVELAKLADQMYRGLLAGLENAGSATNKPSRIGFLASD